MAACRSLLQIFEDPRKHDKTPQTTLLESLSPSWACKPSTVAAAQAEGEPPPFTEIFGELHFRELAPNSFDSYENSKLPPAPAPYANSSSESLHLCTEGLGFESSYDNVQRQGNGTGNFNGSVNDKVESSYGIEQKQGSGTVNFNGSGDGEGERDCDADVNGDGDGHANVNGGCCYRGGGYRREKWRRGRGRTAEEEGSLAAVVAEKYPPPIASIGKNGKPRRSLKAYREEGRFVLEEVMIPTREFLRASREGGRLKMKLVQPEEDEEDDDEGE